MLDYAWLTNTLPYASTNTLPYASHVEEYIFIINVVMLL